MSKSLELKNIRILGKICNVISVLFTVFLCLPIPIIFLFLKNTKKYFSSLDSFEKYLKADMNLETLKKHLNHILLRLIFLSIIFLLVSWFLISENKSNDFEIRMNYIFSFNFLILISLCYYLRFKVIEYLKDN